MTKIEWADETWNPIVGCSKISAGCDNCYAEKQAHRNFECLCGLHAKRPDMKTDALDAYAEVMQWDSSVRMIESALEKPLRWKKPRRIFVCSMGDIFHESVPFEWVDKVMAVIALCPQHTFQILTKRADRMKEYFGDIEDRTEKIANSVMYPPFGVWNNPDLLYDGLFDEFRNYRLDPLPNLWLGVTAENQEMADKRIPLLLQTPAAVRFVSCEPLLGKVDLTDITRKESNWEHHFTALRLEDIEIEDDTDFNGANVGWVIVGCESGANRRPCKLEWVRSIVNQCSVAGVPVLVKQLDIGGKVSKANRGMADWPEDLKIQQYPGGGE